MCGQAGPEAAHGRAGVTASTPLTPLAPLAPLEAFWTLRWDSQHQGRRSFSGDRVMLAHAHLPFLSSWVLSTPHFGHSPGIKPQRPPALGTSRSHASAVAAPVQVHPGPAVIWTTVWAAVWTTQADLVWRRDQQPSLCATRGRADAGQGGEMGRGGQRRGLKPLAKVPSLA